MTTLCVEGVCVWRGLCVEGAACGSGPVTPAQAARSTSFVSFMNRPVNPVRPPTTMR